MSATRCCRISFATAMPRLEEIASTRGCLSTVATELSRGFAGAASQTSGWHHPSGFHRLWRQCSSSQRCASDVEQASCECGMPRQASRSTRTRATVVVAAGIAALVALGIRAAPSSAMLDRAYVAGSFIPAMQAGVPKSDRVAGGVHPRAGPTARNALNSADCDDAGTADSGPKLPTDDDMLALQRMLAEARDKPKMPLLVLDAMVPGQRLLFQSQDPSLPRFAEFDEVGVVGVWKGEPLRHGVIAKLRETGADSWEIVAGDHMEVVGNADRVDGVTTAQVLRLRQEPQEIDVEVAKALPSLVNTWQELVVDTGRERFEGQLDGILDDLGPMPLPEDAEKLAFWVAALVNPLPGLGVALEIRPAVLSSRSVSERLTVVLSGIKDSIGRLSGEAPMF